jgi:hypothetical protein
MVYYLYVFKKKRLKDKVFVEGVKFKLKKILIFLIKIRYLKRKKLKSTLKKFE